RWRASAPEGRTRNGRPCVRAGLEKRASDVAKALPATGLHRDSQSNTLRFLLYCRLTEVCRDGGHSHLSSASEGRGATDARGDLFRPAEAPAPRHQCRRYVRGVSGPARHRRLRFCPLSRYANRRTGTPKIGTLKGPPDVAARGRKREGRRAPQALAALACAEDTLG